MTCPMLAHRWAPPAEVGAQMRSATAAAVRTASAHLDAVLDSGSPVAQLARFAAAGGLATAVQVLLFTLLAPAGSVPATVAAWAVSSALANELHRRRTFRAADRVGWLAAQWEGGGLALLGLGLTTAAVAALTAAVPSASVALQAALVLGVTALVGLARFAALRWTFLVRRAATP